MTAKHYHILGICGRYAAGIAKLLQDHGHIVTGSDYGAYPPITDYLDNCHIPYHDHYAAQHITDDIDTVIVAGNALHLNLNNPEYLQAQKLNLEITSVAEILRDYIVKPEGITVVGTYGKTTVTALLVAIFNQAGLDPAFKNGDITKGTENIIKAADSQLSITEGDEHPTYGYSNRPKFSYYPIKYLLLTAALWDHYNIYQTEEEYIKIFKQAVSRLPEDGLLLANADGENNQEVAKAAKCPVYWYGDSTSETRKSDKPNDVGGELANPPLAEEGENRFDFYAADQTFSERGSSFTFHEADNSFPINLPLLGWHNVANAVAAIAMARLHRIEPGMIQAALANFPGFYRRLECRTNFNGTKIYHDQAQLPVKIKGAMDALRLHYPRHHIVAVLDPHASVLHHPQSLKQYTGIFSTTNQVIVSKMKIRKLHKDESKHDRVTGQKIVKAIAQTQPQVSYQPLDKVLIDQLINLARPDTIIIFLSTGGLRGIIEQVIDKITTN